MYLPDPTEIILWQQAQNFMDICELMALWLEEKIQYQPGYYDYAVASETKPLVPLLSKYNMAGFLSTNSQPGIPINKTGSGQRAWLDGFAQEELARKIMALGLYSDLLIFGYRPEEKGGYMIPVTTYKYHPCTWSGIKNGYELVQFMEICNVSVIRDLEKTWYICIIDPKWGRKEYLWRNVSKVIKSPPENLEPYNIEPSPDS